MIWVKTPDTTPRTWQQALDYANALTLCGFSDWRLPNLIELDSLYNAEPSNSATWLNSQGFTNVQGNYYWSSTTYAATVTPSGGPIWSPAFAWSVNLYAGYLFFHDKASNAPYTWPVRGP